MSDDFAEDGPSAELRRYHTFKKIGAVVSVIVALLAAGKAYSALSYTKQKLVDEVEVSSTRTQRRSVIVVFGGSAIAGVFVGMTAWGITAALLTPLQKKMLYTIYRLDNGVRVGVGSDLTWDEKEAELVRLDLNAPGEYVTEPQ
ncbi:MAG: hypothetical protein GC159_01875 [Phycisphaera sp.]|nr:hypothetical protein [Phycisphaera sp.]